MVGIENIGIWFPENFESNYDLKEKFEIDDYFIGEKIGVRKVARISKEQQASDMCIGAYEDLVKRVGQVAAIDMLVVVTQNPDSNIPHVSAKMHGALGLQPACACFDISLGCSGFVYALSVVEAMMFANGFKKALLFTADPYSKIVEEDDKNTRLLFGDGAAVALISENPVWRTGKFSFGTLGHLSGDLVCTNGRLAMNGRGIFDFAARNVPGDVAKVLKQNNLSKEDIDLFIVHQGSKYMLETLAKKIGIPNEKIPFKASEYGNTVSSSIPIILHEYINEPSVKKILISGFGVGLSYASTVLLRN